jgi:hypothetical protein
MKSVIVSAAIAVTTLFAGAALADDNRDAERPSIQNAITGRGQDASERFANKLRERNESNQRAVTTAGSRMEGRLDKFRPKGDMVDNAGKFSRKEHADHKQARGEKTSRVLKDKVDKRGDVEKNGNKRVFSLANDRKRHDQHMGPKTIVDIQKKKEVLKFLGALGVKINCKETNTCVEETVM